MLCYCFTPYQRLWLYNGAPLVAFYDTLGIRRTYSRLKPRRPQGGEEEREAQQEASGTEESSSDEGESDSTARDSSDDSEDNDVDPDEDICQ